MPSAQASRSRESWSESRRTAQDAREHTRLLLPDLEAASKHPYKYSVVPGLPEYTTLPLWERRELSENMKAVRSMLPLDPLWVNKVTHDWDYKHREDWGHAYADFGNVNFGATGNVVVGWDRLLYAGAGWAQERLPGSADIYESKYGKWTDFFDPSQPTKTSLFGDRPEDRAMVDVGIQIGRSYDLITTLTGERPFGLRCAESAAGGSCTSISFTR
jgi:hypothetical protein